MLQANHSTQKKARKLVLGIRLKCDSDIFRSTKNWNAEWNIILYPYWGMFISMNWQNFSSCQYSIQLVNTWNHNTVKFSVAFLKLFIWYPWYPISLKQEKKNSELGLQVLKCMAHYIPYLKANEMLLQVHPI